MIYLLSCGDGFSGGYYIHEVLDGPEGLDTDAMWEAYEGALEKHTGYFPQDYKSPEYRSLCDQHRARKAAFIAALVTDLKIDSAGDRPLLRCFVAMLIRDHGCKSLENIETYTEN